MYDSRVSVEEIGFVGDEEVDIVYFCSDEVENVGGSVVELEVNI